MYQLQKHDQMNLILQTEMPYHKRTKSLHCRITKQLQKCVVPFNISEESVNKVGKKKIIIFGISSRATEMAQNSTHICPQVWKQSNLINL